MADTIGGLQYIRKLDVLEVIIIYICNLHFNSRKSTFRNYPNCSLFVWLVLMDAIILQFLISPSRYPPLPVKCHESRNLPSNKSADPSTISGVAENPNEWFLKWYQYTSENHEYQQLNIPFSFTVLLSCVSLNTLLRRPIAHSAKVFDPFCFAPINTRAPFTNSNTLSDVGSYRLVIIMIKYQNKVYGNIMSIPLRLPLAHFLELQKHKISFLHESIELIYSEIRITFSLGEK